MLQKYFIPTQIVCLRIVSCKDDNKHYKKSATLTSYFTDSFYFPSLTAVKVFCYHAVPLYCSTKRLCTSTVRHRAICVLRFSFTLGFSVEACTSNCWYLIGWASDSNSYCHEINFQRSE